MDIAKFFLSCWGDILFGAASLLLSHPTSARNRVLDPIERAPFQASLISSSVI